MATFIPDGYTRDDGYVKGSTPDEETGEQLYGPVAFSYRVATRVEVEQIDREVNDAYELEITKKKPYGESEKIGCAWLAKRISSWDLTMPDKTPVPIVAENFGRIHPSLFGRIYSIVRNQQLSDKKPDATKEPPTTEEMQKN